MLQAVPFLEGTYSDSYNYDTPCPPMPDRVAEYEHGSGKKVTAITAMPHILARLSSTPCAPLNHERANSIRRIGPCLDHHEPRGGVCE